MELLVKVLLRSPGRVWPGNLRTQGHMSACHCMAA